MGHLRSSSPMKQLFRKFSKASYPWGSLLRGLLKDLFPADQSGSGAHTAIARVATLFPYAFRGPREGFLHAQSSSSDSRVSSRPASFLSRRTSSTSYYCGGDNDYVVKLNSLLQVHPTGNLTPFCQYVMTRESRGQVYPYCYCQV